MKMWSPLSLNYQEFQTSDSRASAKRGAPVTAQDASWASPWRQTHGGAESLFFTFDS